MQLENISVYADGLDKRRTLQFDKLFTLDIFYVCIILKASSFDEVILILLFFNKYTIKYTIHILFLTL